jgi:hypothetical protein
MKNFWLNKFPDFDSFINKKDKSNLEKLLIQCIASLSTQAAYCHMTPQEVYNKQVEYTKSVHGI